MPERTDDKILDRGHATQAVMSAVEAAAMLGVSEHTIRRAIAHDQLQAIKHAGVYQITPDDLARFCMLRGVQVSSTTHVRRESTQLTPPPDRFRTRAFHGPRSLTQLIGRDQELGDLRDRLLDEQIRLVTLTGPGGVGKTRLALETGLTLQDSFASGTWFIDLLPVTNPAHVSGAIARALRMRDSGGQLLVKRLIDYLARRRALLILDNFERVTTAAPLIVALLTSCPELKVLVTSRVSLHVTGEHQVPVRPLSCPDPKPLLSMAEVAGSGAVRLFVTRAEAVEPDFRLTETNMSAVAAICRRLDGLPLAIELAAARAKHLNPSAMLARLDRRLELLTLGMQDHPSRMQSMRDAVAWSYDMLTPGEQQIFRRLAVFIGGFTLNAAVAICEGGTPDPRSVRPDGNTGSMSLTLPAAVLDSISSLIDKSLVEQDSASTDAPRFTMLETLREFGWEKLEASGELDTIRERHASWCLNEVQSVEAERIGLAPPAATDRLGPDRENVRTALQWVRDQGEVGTGLRLASALWPLWLERGEVSEGRACLSALLSLPGASIDKAVWAKAVCVSGALAQALGDHVQAVELSKQALEVFDEIEDLRGAAAALNTLGLDAMIQGDNRSAIVFLEDSLARFRKMNDPRAGTWALRHLSSVAFRLGDIGRASALAEEGIAIARASGSHLDVARLLLNLSSVASAQGNLDRAGTLSTEALNLFQTVGDRWGVADALQRLGRLAFEGGETATSLELLNASLVLFQEVGDPEGVVIVLVLLGWLHRATGSAGMAAEYVAEGLTIARQRENPSRIASALLAYGALALDLGNHDAAAGAWKESLALASAYQEKLAIAAALEWTAHLTVARNCDAGARMLGAASTIRDVHNTPVAASRRVEFEQLIGALRSNLGGPSFTKMFTIGEDMPLDAATSEAIDILHLATSHSRGKSRTAQSNPSRPRLAGLSPREIEVLQQLAKGKSNREISTALYISPRTTDNHLLHIYDKIGVSSRVEATLYAIRNGLV